ncbi:unnamed protein product [Psylliodes chrysocephalus]|uniref:C2H2-type domain-containing protein n=1 Tax=Psylliodes chrysocephalus TaxID=3402493 RepID=A0A9P0CLM2_9CUCU|nr:unnamed protein product [Psylliodes chrysocephala]
MSQQALKKHDRNVHNFLKQVIYECEKCNEAYTSKRKLRDHFRVHYNNNNNNNNNNKKKQFKCKECGKCYSLQKYLHEHFKKKHRPNGVDTEIHSSKPSCTYQYHNCDLTFVLKLDIIKHVKIHQISHKNLLYPVQECNQDYNRYVTIRSHLTEEHNLHLRKETVEFSNKTGEDDNNTESDVLKVEKSIDDINDKYENNDANCENNASDDKEEIDEDEAILFFIILIFARVFFKIRC